MQNNLPSASYYSQNMIILKTQAPVMRMYLCYLLFLWFGTPAALAEHKVVATHPLHTHPFHVSVCKIHYNLKTNDLEIVQRVFLDDIEQALTKQLPQLDIVTQHQTTALEQVLRSYFRTNLMVSINGEKTPWEWVGHEIQDAHLVLYMRIAALDQLNHLHITSYVLNDFDDQKNWVHVQAHNSTQSIILTKHQPSGTIRW